MMKKVFSFFMLVGLMLGGQISFAQPSTEGSVEEVLAASLKELKQSYQKLVDQNRFLTSQIETYRNEIPALSKELESLESDKAIFSHQINADQTTASVYQQEIEELKQKIGSLSRQVPENTLEERKKQLQQEIAANKVNLHRDRLELERLKREPAESAKIINQLKAVQAQLQRQILNNKSRWEIESAKAYVRQLDQEIAKLKLEREKLEKSDEGGDISNLTEESYQLRRRFMTLEYENMRLKKEISRYPVGNSR